MDSNHVSPPKAERTLFEDITESGPIHISGRNGNSVKKRLKIEQENIDISNLTHSGQGKKFGYTKKNSNYISPLIPRVLSFYTPQINLMGMPYDIHMEILKFLTPMEILKSVQLVNKYWHKACNDTGLWNSINRTQPLNIDIKYLKRGCVAERRSKGKLFKAASRLTEQEVMIRKINLIVANAGHDDGLPTSILREISYLSSLDHVNISKILEVEVKKDTIQICTKFYDYNLKEYMKLHLQSNKEYSLKAYLLQPNSVYKMPLKTVKLLSYQMLKGLCYLHHQGIIHRNLKSDNLLITKNGQLKITDFALSKLITVPHIPYTPEDPKDRERSGREARRLWYRAPELLLRKNMYSFEIDIWSFGCVLAELAMNEPMFNGDTEIEQLFQVFRLIGSPNTSSWSTLNDSSEFKAMFPRWESIYFPHVCYPHDSDEYKKVYKTMMPNREKAFAKLKNLGSVVGIEGLDLIWNCLSLNPQTRASASTLINHKFFDEIRDEMCVKYIGKSCCPNKTCENAGCYTIPNMLDCHLLSYYNSIRNQEAELRPQNNYLLRQPIINENMRCILVDWLIDVSVHFEVLDETLHLCANYIDRVLSKMKIDKSKLQLVGVTCMKIADVFNERSKEYYKQENSTEYAYITAEEYTPQQLIDMEKVVLNLLGFRLNTPNAMQFVKILVHLLSIPDETALVAMFLVDLMLLSYQMLEFDYSLIANSALFIACRSTEFQIDTGLLGSYKAYLEVHSKKDFEKCVNAIKNNWNVMRTTTTYANFEAVYTKYQVRHSFLAKTLNPPDIKSKDLENWFYTKN